MPIECPIFEVVGKFENKFWQLREHPSLVEFRKKMIDVERVAREAASRNDVPDLRYEISRIITDELSEELFNTRTTPDKLAFDIAIDLLAGSIPGISTVITAFRGDEKSRKENLSWTTTFFKLQKRIL